MSDIGSRTSIVTEVIVICELEAQTRVQTSINTNFNTASANTPHITRIWPLMAVSERISNRLEFRLGGVFEQERADLADHIQLMNASTNSSSGMRPVMRTRGSPSNMMVRLSSSVAILHTPLTSGTNSIPS